MWGTGKKKVSLKNVWTNYPSNSPLKKIFCAVSSDVVRFFSVWFMLFFYENFDMVQSCLKISVKTYKKEKNNTLNWFYEFKVL